MAQSCHIIWYNEVDSTNTEAAKRLSELDNMSVIAARSQTAGRGKGTRKWHSAPGANLTFTIVLKYAESNVSITSDGKKSVAEGLLPLFPASSQMLISAVAAASIVCFLKKMGISAWVKWPNDVYVDKRKICGILIEHRTDGKHLKSSIIGIGINLNQTIFPPELVNPVSVAALTGKKYDADTSLMEFCTIFVSKMELAYSKLPHLGDVISRAFALENGTSGNENLRACFAQCVNVLL